jgi:hypothetical protein
MSQRKRIIIEETNEVHLISELAKVVTDWVKDLRFTIEKDTDLNLTDEDKSATPQVYKYYLPKRENNKREEPITRRNVNFPVPDVIPLFPALVIRPSNGSADVDENSSDYEDVNIDICIFVKEYDVSNRYDFLLLAKKIIMQKLRGIPLGIFANYRLQNNLSWKLYDDSQEPDACLVITSVWRCRLPPAGAFDVSQIE